MTDSAAVPKHRCDGYDWRSGLARPCMLRLGHKGSCSGDPCEHPVYMDGRCYDCGEPHPADCDCAMRPPGPRHCVERTDAGWRCVDCGRVFGDVWPSDDEGCPGRREANA